MVMASSGLDIARLAIFASLPESTLNDLLTSPTVTLIQSLLSNLILRAREQDEAQSAKLKLKVELENALRAGEAKAKVVKTSLNKNLEEISKLRQQLQLSESAKQSLDTELQSLKSTTSNTDSEVSTLRSRINSLETSQRDNLALLDKKSAAYDELANELSAKHQKTVELRRQVSTLDQDLSSARSQSSSFKLREQELRQEAEALKTHNEWLDQELKTKSAEHSKFRKEKNSRVAELQQQNEDATTSIESLQRTEQNLRARAEELNQKAEDHLSQIHALREESSRNEENFRVEINTANRLSDLLKESLDTEHARQQDLSEQLDDAKQSAAEEIGRIGVEIESEHQDRVAAERRVAELEVHVERLEADAQAISKNPELTGTPRARLNGSGFDISQHGSPARSPMPGIRGGLSYTQLVSDYHVAKNELDAEKRRSERLSDTLDEIVRDMELRQPEIDALQTDHTRLEADIVDMTDLLETSGKERDQARKDSRKFEREIVGLTREGELLRQQLRDLASQVKILLMELNAKNEGFGDFTPEQRAALESLAHGDLDGEGAAPVSDTYRFISEHLTTFRRIDELEEQNIKLRRVARELGERMEGEEAKQARIQAAQNQEELEALQSKFETSKEEIKILTTQSQSYIRERDIFRRMLSHRGQLPQDADVGSMFAESVNGAQPPLTPMKTGPQSMSPSSKEIRDLTTAIKEVQSQYDNYRHEAGQHQTMLKQQTEMLSKQNSELRNDISKKTNEATLASDRYEMLHGNYSMLKSENQELQKRSQTMSDRVSKQEIRTQQVAEDLVEARGIAEGLRNETANLKAEKELWKTIEKRLNEEVAGLGADRDRLNDSYGTLQNVLNEREHADAETRRRGQAQLDTLETELLEAKKKLADEVEENKRATLRREYDSQQKQSKVEELMTNLAKAREELVAAQTTRDHLQARTDELSIELRSAQERLNVLQPRLTPQHTQALQNQDSTGAGIDREQELGLEVSDLKRDLELAQKELADQRGLVEQYKAISQGSEEELQSLNETHDQYRLETDRLIEERGSRIKELEENAESLRVEIRNVNAELLEAQSLNQQHDQQMQAQKAKSESETNLLKDSVERAQAAAQYHQEDLKKQAEIAQQAQQNYDHELLKHAEATRSLQNVRAELNQLRLETLELRTAADSAQNQLSQNEESWTEAKERYERELTEIRTRRDDMANQNKILHTQLDTLNKHISELRNKRTPDVNSSEASASGVEGDLETQNLQELIKYIRQEKDIVDTQFLRSAQESKRLRQQLDHTQNQLDEVRLKLAQEQHAKENSERQTLNHNKLMETLQELNLYRESNTTLRLEKSQIQNLLDEKVKSIENLQGQMLPLQAKLSELEEAREMQDTELRLATEAKDRFEKRYLDVLNRSNAVDPAEFEATKQKVSDLQGEVEQLLQTRNDLQGKVDGFPDELKQELDQANERYQESRAKLIEQSKNKAREQTTKIRERDATVQTLTQEKLELEGRLETLKIDLEQANLAKDEATNALEQQQAPKESVHSGTQVEGQVIEADGGQAVTSTLEIEDMRQQLEAADQKVKAETMRASKFEGQVRAAESRVAQLEKEIATLRNSIHNANEELATLKAQNQSAMKTWRNTDLASDTDGEVARTHQEELSRLQEEAEDLRTKLEVFEHAEKVEEEGSVTIAEQIASQVEDIRRELTARHEARVKQEEEKYNKRVQSMKSSLNKQLSAVRNESQQKIDNAVAQALQSLKDEHNVELQALNTRHSEELAELRRHSRSTENGPAKRPLDAGEVVREHKQLGDGKWEPSEEDVKELLMHNQYARKQVMTSINNRERKAREEEQKNLMEKISKAREEEQQKLANQLKDVESKINKAKSDAEVMIEKKFAVKINMTDNRIRNAQAKIDYIQKAATETPDEAVSNVWAVAKDTKAAPPPTAKPTTQPNTGSNAGTSSQLQTPATSLSTSTQSNPFTPDARLNPFGQPNQSTTQIAATSNTAQTYSVNTQPQAGSQIPTKAVSSLQQSSHAPIGRGQLSALPRGGTMNRGRNASGIPRGGARGGAGRGAIQAVNTTLAANAQQSQDSPKTAKGMNPAAQQFVPGQKRGLDASEHATGDEKRRKSETG